ncbi:hypothetical protein GGTG_02965 [Gaeumannomyces tritici R3-111a-1]|uniref:Pentatricopeptide repeat protein n=1 Tax=Gaeumannomyces tritici (strain R3-111a-1) TaxID=644352 RepID=J3NNV9_GAET3|nr:hypothetical protein GGTG_02965 [Gaeumannomyces tritici R3-111a-1]EJT77862.1 hypothetical protein GGTG_02965 [Gaeumannomyces tritici R3-111a-1]
MPALERSAAVLEPCSFGKALSAVRSSRKLYTSFWRHGAADVEFSPAWQALAAPTPPGDATPHVAAVSSLPARRDAPLMASVFLFDFLYPQGARSLLQRPSPGPLACFLDRHELPRPRSVAKAAARAYSSSADSDEQPPEPTKPDKEGEEAAPPEDSSEDPAQPAQPETPINIAFPIHALRNVIKGQQPIQIYGREVTAAEREEEALGVSGGALRAELREGARKPDSPPADVDDSKSAESIEAFEQLWEDYMALPDEEKLGRRPGLISALGKSRRLTEAWRISELFHEIAEEAWTADSVAALIRSEISLQNTPEAVRVFKAWASRGHSPSGFGSLASRFLGISSWSDLEDICAFCLGIPAAQDLEEPAVEQPPPEETAVDKHTSDFLAAMGEATPEPPGVGAEKVLHADSEESPHSRQNSIDEIGSERKLKLDQVDIDEIGSTPDLLEKLSQLYVFVHQGTESPRTKAALGPLLSGAVSWFLSRFPAETAMAVVKHYGNPLLYEQFIRLTVNRGQKALATYAYFLYRELPGVKIRIPIIHLMIDGVFRPNGDARRMETVLQDWRSRYDHLDRWGYKKYLSLYAMTGNIRSFEAMQKEFLSHYPGEHAMVLPYLMRINGILGRTQAVERIIDVMEQRYHVKPTTAHFNILLSSYAKKTDMQAAATVFSRLCEVATPDEQSFAAIMSVLGRTGDLDFLQRLEQMARSRGVQITPEMRAHIIDAYCQNGYFADALDLCTSATKAAGSRLSKKRAAEVRHMWHTLLVHYGKKRDLKAVHRTLKLMTGFEVQFDQWTYSHLLMALAYCRQAHHALHLFRAGIVEGFLRPSAKHFLTLMVAFIESGEPHMVLRVDRLMDRLDLPPSAERTLRKISARLQWDRQPHFQQQKPDPDVNFSDALADLLTLLQQQPPPVEMPSTTTSSGASDLATMSEIQDDLLAGVLMFAVKQGKDGAVRKLLEAFNKNAARGAGGQNRGAIRTLEAVMLHELGKGRLDNVKATWDALFDMACKMGRPLPSLGRMRRTIPTDDSGEGQVKVLPAFQYLLTRGFNTMLEVLKAEKDGEGIVELLGLMLDEGFSLTGRSWNYYVQALAHAGKVHEAFVVCEEMLMPNWTGWYQVRLAAREVDPKLPSDLRRLGTAPEHRRPTSFTFVELRLHYKDLLRRAIWYKETEAELAKVERDAASTIKAIRTMRRPQDPREIAQRYGLDELDEYADAPPEGDEHADAPPGGEAESDDWEEFLRGPVAARQKPRPQEQGSAEDPGGEQKIEELLRLVEDGKKAPLDGE